MKQTPEPLLEFLITYLIDHKRQTFRLLAKGIDAARTLAISEMKLLSPEGKARILRVEEVR
jgi:hypothetical protein